MDQCWCSAWRCVKAGLPAIGVQLLELDPTELKDASITLEIAGKQFEATVSSMDDQGCGGSNGTSYYLKYKKKAGSRGRAKAAGWVDLELPVGEKCSWWRLSGYDTCSEKPAGSDVDTDGEDGEDGEESSSDGCDDNDSH